MYNSPELNRSRRTPATPHIHHMHEAAAHYLHIQLKQNNISRRYRWLKRRVTVACAAESQNTINKSFCLRKMLRIFSYLETNIKSNQFGERRARACSRLAPTRRRWVEPREHDTREVGARATQQRATIKTLKHLHNHWYSAQTHVPM